MKLGTCKEVADIDCRAPACLGGHGGPVAECFKCGEEVCTSRGCSRRRAYLRYGRRRLCQSCDEEEIRCGPMWRLRCATWRCPCLAAWLCFYPAVGPFAGEVVWFCDPCKRRQPRPSEAGPFCLPLQTLAAWGLTTGDAAR